MTMIRDVMSKDVQWVVPETTLEDAAKKMEYHDIGFLPVGENDRLIGSVTDRDITVRAVAQGRHPKADTVRFVMTPKIYYCFDDQDVSEVCDNMAYNKMRRLVVLNRRKRLVGIVSLGDLAQACAGTQAGEALRQICAPERAAAKAA